MIFICFVFVFFIDMRPFKVWSADRTLKKMIIAKSYEDLMKKGTWKY